MSREVPDGWSQIKIGDIGSFFGGLTGKTAKDFGEGHPFLTYMQVYLQQTSDVEAMNSVRIDEGEKQNVVAYGDILFTTSSETPDEIGMTDVFLQDNQTPYLNSFCFGLRPITPSPIDPTFGKYVFRGDDFREDMRPLAQGSTRFNLSKGNLAKLSLLVPPLPEQKKIASILTSVDDVIENTQKQIDKLQDLKKATMNELLTKGIGHTEFKDSELERIPKSWEVVTLRDICKVRQGLQIPIAERFNQGGESRYPYLTVAWINSNFAANKAEFIGNPSKSVVLKSDEFVVGRTGAVGQIFDGLECVFHNNFFAVSLLHTSVEKEFLKHFLKWHLTQDLLLKLAGSTTIPDLNHGDFYSVNLRLPAPEEQQRIIRVLDHFDLEISTRKKKLHQTQSLKKSLMQDLLTGKVRVTVN